MNILIYEIYSLYFSPHLNSNKKTKVIESIITKFFNS
jgi:hypothetical protein